MVMWMILLQVIAGSLGLSNLAASGQTKPGFYLIEVSVPKKPSVCVTLVQ